MLGIKKKEQTLPDAGVVEGGQYEELRTMHGAYQTTLTEAYRSRKAWSAPNPKEVYSFIPGTILELTVPVGGLVKKGDRLLMFKAMKMNNSFLSPIDGRVKAIYVSEGEVVPKGRLLLEFE